MPSFSISIVKLREGWAWFRVFSFTVAVVMLLRRRCVGCGTSNELIVSIKQCLNMIGCH